MRRSSPSDSRPAATSSHLARAIDMQMKKREKDNEWHLMSQIKELSRQLEAERSRIKMEESDIGGQQKREARLIVAANRLPVTPVKNKVSGEWEFKRSSGGLVSAFLGVRNFKITWVGWVGVDVPAEEREEVTRLLSEQQPFRCVPVYLDEQTAEDYYNGFSNNVLWPLLHYIPLSMLDSHGDAAERQWAAYQTANQGFCDAVLTLNPTELDTVWVQDYHLMLAPKYLRDASPELSIGWFLHTPFVTPEMYATLPHREEILRGVLGADLCGFHVYDYAQHFHNSCGQVLGIGGESGVTQGNDGLFDHASRRSICVDTFPIGIDPAPFERAIDSPTVKDRIIDLQRRFDGKRVLLGIDRLDYVKGIPHKLKALEYFLQEYPQWRGKVVLLQIAVPSRTEVAGYQKLRANVHRLVSRINGTFGTLDYVPIHYLDQSMNFPELCALYYRADVMVVTSLRDGMNLVSFEFLACQSKKGSKGALVLSEFAGAAQALGAGALLVNPYNVAEVAKAIYVGLNMTAKEREERFTYLDSHIHGHTAQEWAEQFVASLRHAREASNYDAGFFSKLTEARTLPVQEVISSYKACERANGQKLLVFGLLGTLIEYSAFKKLENLLPSVRRNLSTLASSPSNTVVVVSGRERALMNEWLGELPIWLVAENGLWIRPPPRDGQQQAGETASSPAWEMTKDEVDDSWMASLKPIFRYFEARTPDTLTEVQEHTITWHFQDADDEFADVQAVALQSHLVKVSNNSPVEVGLDMKRVEVRPYGVSKGAALTMILEQTLARWRADQRVTSEERLARLEEESQHANPTPPTMHHPALSLQPSGSNLPDAYAGASDPTSDPASTLPASHGGRGSASSATLSECSSDRVSGFEQPSQHTPMSSSSARETASAPAACGRDVESDSRQRSTTLSELAGIPAAIESSTLGRPAPIPPPIPTPPTDVQPPGSASGSADFAIPLLPPAVLAQPSAALSEKLAALPSSSVREADGGLAGCGGASTIGAISTVGESSRAAGREKLSHFDWVLCLSEVMARDEDLFAVLKDHCEMQTRDGSRGGNTAATVPLSRSTTASAPPELMTMHSARGLPSAVGNTALSDCWSDHRSSDMCSVATAPPYAPTMPNLVGGSAGATASLESCLLDAESNGSISLRSQSAADILNAGSIHLDSPKLSSRNLGTSPLPQRHKSGPCVQVFAGTGGHTAGGTRGSASNSGSSMRLDRLEALSLRASSQWGSGIRLDQIAQSEYGAPVDDGQMQKGSSTLWTCCVGKKLSKAEFYIDYDGTAGLLDLLAHASHDGPSTPGITPAKPQMPSVLERLPQLVRYLVGKQLLFLLDYEGCDAAIPAAADGATSDRRSDLPSERRSENSRGGYSDLLPPPAALPSPSFGRGFGGSSDRLSQLRQSTGGGGHDALNKSGDPSAAGLEGAALATRLAQLYPTAIVSRAPLSRQPAETNPDPWSLAAERIGAAAARATRGDGDISGVQILPFTPPLPPPPPVPSSHSWNDLSTFRNSASTVEARRRSANAAAAAAAAASAAAAAAAAAQGDCCASSGKTVESFSRSTSLGGASSCSASADLFESASERANETTAGCGEVESLVYEISYRPALESCWSKLSDQLSSVMEDSGVSIEDNHFSLSVDFRGASDDVQAFTREAVVETIEKDFPMLRFVEERMTFEVRPYAGWNRSKAVEWLVKTVVERVCEKHGMRSVVPVYIGDDQAFQSIREIQGGLYVLVTGGPGSSDGSYFLRDTSQVDQLLRFFVEQAVAGVTVRGGSLHARRHPDGRLSGPSANQQLLLAEGMRRRMPIRLAPDPKRVGGPQGQTPKAWGPLTTSDAIKDG